jgi:hypothetical protein
MDATQACANVAFIIGPTTSDRRGGRDGQSVVVWLTDRWGAPDGPSSFAYYSPDAVALTTAFFVDDSSRPDDGRIVEADVELNAVNFQFAVVPDDAGATRLPDCVMDLRNTLVHELGHVLGLDHDPSHPEASMYPDEQCREISKRSPAADDIAGVCAIYPIGSGDGMVCGNRQELRGGGSGCALAHRAAEAPSGLVVVLAAVLLLGLRGGWRARRR